MSKSRIIAALCALAFGLSLGVSAIPLTAQTGEGNMVMPQEGVYLFQPLDDGEQEIAPSPGIDVFFEYFNRGWPYVVGIAAGVAVLQVLVAGVQIMISSGGQMRSEGVERLQWAIVGLIMLALAGFILRTLNPIFYK